MRKSVDTTDSSRELKFYLSEGAGVSCVLELVLE